jgi:crotonobetainyl-CoA:carnitine CoA-transferase CaiB-like acyl-CoA transferase
MRSRLLQGLRALDLTTELAWDCGRILASYGVEVLRLDTPDGAAACTDEQGDGAVAWRIAHADKQCSVLDYGSPEGYETLQALLADADFLLESFTPAEAAELGLEPAAVRARHPHLVQVSISAFGRIGPRAGWRGGELVAAAMSGIVSTGGDADRPPVREPCRAHFFHACAAGALGALIAHHERRRSGRGQWVDISAQETGTNRNTTWLIAHQFDQRAVQRAGANFGATRGIWRVRDGFVAFALMGGKFGGPANKALSDWMDELGYDNPIRDVDWDRFMVQDVTDAMRAEWIPKLDAFFADRTRTEFATEGRQRGITATPLSEPAETLADPQLQARGLFDAAQRLGGVPLRLPGYYLRTGCDEEMPLRVPDRPGVDPLPAPRIAGAAGWRAAAAGGRAGHVSGGDGATDAPRDPPALPLAGIRLLDFSWAIVGGTTAKYLGDFGAEVVKIESRKRIGLERLSNTSRVSKPGNLDDKPWFAHVNSSKQSFCLNLSDVRSRPIIEGLVGWADVVLENFSPGTMDKLGLSFEAMRRIKPSIILASGSVFGQTGPQRHYWGVDSTGAAASSRMFMTGWADRGPVLPSAPYGDCMLPCFLAAGLLAALDRRERTGEGCHIDGSMFEVLVQQMLPEIVAQQRAQSAAGSAVHARRRGNREPLLAPHGVYPCLGSERWIAIEVACDADWAALRRALGEPPALTDARFATHAGRLASQDALDVALGECTRSLDAYLLMERAQSQGVAAGVVQFAADTLERDPQLRARGFVQRVDHPLLGAFEHLASPIWLSRTPQQVRPAPRLGEHTRALGSRLLGLAPEALDELERAQVLY